jgi:hypothetical protein
MQLLEAFLFKHRLTILENCPSRMVGKSKVALKHTLIELCNKAAYKNYKITHLSLIKKTLTRTNLLCCIIYKYMYVHRKPWMTEKSLVQCIVSTKYHIDSRMK